MTGSSVSICENPRTAFNGVRSSWLIEARKSDFARLVSFRFITRDLGLTLGRAKFSDIGPQPDRADGRTIVIIDRCRIVDTADGLAVGSDEFDLILAPLAGFRAAISLRRTRLLASSVKSQT